MANDIDCKMHLDPFIQSAMIDWEIPGLSLGIVHRGEIIWNKGYGYTDLSAPLPVDEDTLFAIGSNTKAFTATAIGLLVAEGKLGWDDPVSRYLLEYALADPIASSAVTVRDLLCHRAGLGTWNGDLLSFGSSYNREEIIRRLRYIPPAYPFRSGYGYCNLNFMAAGQIIPAVTGISWDDFMEQRILSPLGMTVTLTSLSKQKARQVLARPHEWIEHSLQPVIPRDIFNIAPAGAMYSSCADMLRWIQMQLGNGSFQGTQIVPAEIIRETHQPHTPIRLDDAMLKLVPGRHFYAYGLGWFLMDYHGHEIIFHTGGVDGMLSLVGLVPEEDLGVVILSNKLPQYFYNALFYQILDAFWGLPYRDWNAAYHTYAKEAELKSEENRQKTWPAFSGISGAVPLSAYAGAYRSTVYGTATVTEKSNSLQLGLSAHPGITGRFEPWSEHTFLCHWSDPIFNQSLIPFTVDSDGNPVEFHLKVREDWIDPLEYIFIKCNSGNKQL